ncbi:3',5'-cyclic-AMP phosphodiesterase [Marinobacter sp. F3R11]|uniref:3',5'-cyclic-AMP phosphodiesterase n=1 Tax=Marinobacter sp. F3R11 TaxID=2267231 RepID=UPI000DEA88E3|nr:3',5'-cyclic-AMP phosphodiesterase [Marinobacter sp. F3R11]RBW48144.1 3',5'-cyclic-AMP phosphodiesterase [Marinobacter sp. F3R11]
MTSKVTARPFRVLQLTDPHLMISADGALLGVNTRDSLDAVIAEVLKSHGQPDLILATGDIAQDATEEAYHVFGDRLGAFTAGSAWIAGNHDHAGRLAKVAAFYGSDRRHIVEGGWQFILLNSSVPGEVFGNLAESELEFLAEMLEQHPDLPTLVALHHHPVDISAEWMRDIGLRNREDFWQVIDRFPQVKMVLWGHIHQTHERQRNGVQLLATPSTCIQFTSGSRKFSVEDLAPGYRWFELEASGNFTTEVCRAMDFKFELDQNSSGY